MREADRPRVILEATMYDMWAEHDPAAVDGRVLLWHVITKDDASKSLCGRLLQAGRRAPVPADTEEDMPSDRYCAPCMSTVRETMAAADR
ncbi:hypothetical protein [Kitasatospora sp. MAP5-34]|uniref:hypothetical protein n=1 Tax=Kitasatospora sp. MAP5-34 TaxID=3035102 RepID=UPI002476CDCC|nr:hypothetical protein [Kitasatospora sp. MAP5-34]MDH6580568.1 hypothetical protein [Kitasatospora sp. MAP5-34]